MSKKDVITQYLKVEKDYFDIVELAKQVDKEREGVLTQEQIDNFANMIKAAKVNYETWSYVVYLLNKTQHKDCKKYFDGESEKLHKVNEDILNKFKEWREKNNG